MNCLCNIFDNSTTWLIIIALLILFFGCGGTCNNCGVGSCGCNPCDSTSGRGCGCC